MTENEIHAFILNLYNESQAREKDKYEDISGKIKDNLDFVASSADNSKAVLAVVLTSLVYKALNPKQDVRCHQAQIEGGYAGRIFDSKFITPFLRSQSFPSMAESGWLTRSFEQPMPYDEKYPGNITPKSLKSAFLEILKAVEEEQKNVRELIVFLFSRLSFYRDNRLIQAASPKNLSIETIIYALNLHFAHKYHSRGASRLPVLGIYAIYQALMTEMKRFEGMTLLPLENHTSADSQSGMLGDIEVVDEQGNPFEAVEVKSDVPINLNYAERAKAKILPTSIRRYYILSCVGTVKSDMASLEEIVQQIKNTHGCQMIINGIVPTLKYYLRLLQNPSVFVENYANLLMRDKTVKYEHRKVWNEIISHL